MAIFSSSIFPLIVMYGLVGVLVVDRIMMSVLHNHAVTCINMASDQIPNFTIFYNIDPM